MFFALILVDCFYQLNFKRNFQPSKVISDDTTMIYFKGSCFKFTRETHRNRAVFEEAQTELFNLNLCFDLHRVGYTAVL